MSGEPNVPGGGQMSHICLSPAPHRNPYFIRQVARLSPFPFLPRAAAAATVQL